VAKAAPNAPEKAPEKSAEKTAEKSEPRKEEKKPVSKPAFKAKEFVVYPAHGVGQILDIEEQEVAGHKLELFVISFDKEKMTLRVPTNKAQAVGMRKLSDATVVDSALETLRGRARIKRTMWSRRAQEYEAKINSGDLISIAEVVRDLYRSERQPEQSYSERQLYEAALDRMARRKRAIERIGEDAAIQRVEAALQGGSGRGEKAAKAAAVEPDSDDDDDENEAA
jgi:CarD family transcriptional regulator